MVFKTICIDFQYCCIIILCNFTKNITEMRTLILTLLFTMSIFCNAQDIAETRSPIYERGAHSIELSVDNQLVFNFKNLKYKDIERMESIMFDSYESSIQFFEKVVEILDQEAPTVDDSSGAAFGNVFLKRYGSFPTVVSLDTQKGYTYLSKRNALQIIEVLKLQLQSF